MIEHGERDVDQQQAGNRLIDAAVLPQASREHDPEAAAKHSGAYHRGLHDERGRPWHRERRRRRRECADQERAFAADDHHAELRRQRRAKCGQDQRRRARQRVLPGEPGPECALVHVEIKIERIFSEHGHEYAEQAERAEKRRARNQDVFDGCAMALQESRVGGRSYSGRIHGIGCVCCHEVAPSTPSTR